MPGGRAARAVAVATASGDTGSHASASAGTSGSDDAHGLDAGILLLA